MNSLVDQERQVVEEAQIALEGEYSKIEKPVCAAGYNCSCNDD